MIDLMTRIRTEDLYSRMVASARKTADGPFNTLFEHDDENLPRLAETYNRLARRSHSDILCFVHDDIEFLSDGWDTTISELFLEYDADIIGVVGTTKYEGGRIFDSGNAYALGHFCCNVDGEPYVKVLSKYFRYKPAKVVDGMLMFCRRSYWEREKFDLEFDQLFFYDTDFCLRGKVGVTCNILAKHSKPADLYGKYPVNLAPISVFEQAFNRKHGFKHDHPIEKPVCAMSPLPVFLKTGQNDVYEGFMEKYGATTSPR